MSTIVTMDYHHYHQSMATHPHLAAPNVEAAPDAAREAWALINGLFKAEKGRHLAALELTMAQAHLLLNLDPDRPVPMNTLADTLGCDASNVTGLVDRLEARNLIERRADPADRRVKMIGVTAAGAEFRTKLLNRWYEPPAPLAALPERDKKALLEILRKATRAQDRE